MIPINRRQFLRTVASASVGLYDRVPPGRDTGAASAPPAGAVCLKSAPPARTLWAIHVDQLDTLSYLEPHEHQPDERLPLTCLQGLVNRRQPRLFLAFDRFDELWLEWLRVRGDIHDVRWVGTRELYGRFLAMITGLVVTDPDVPATVNIATMLAGVNAWLPVTPRLLPAFDVKVAMDLRGRWKRDVDAYRWFYRSYGSWISRRMCASLDPGIHAPRDYLVEFRVPIVWVSGPHDAESSRVAVPAEEEAFARALFLELPPNIPCLGWWAQGQAGEAGIGEDRGVTLASEYAKFQVTTGWDGWAYPVGNLSVHSGTSAVFRQRTPSEPTLTRRIYLTFTRTDGDGLNFWRHVYRQLWSDPDHGRVPIGWQLAPTSYDLMPDVIDYYYKHATPNDVFICALTGMGYVHEQQYGARLPEGSQQAVWDEYLALTVRYMRLLDLSLLATYQDPDPSLLSRFATVSAVRAVFACYARCGHMTPDNVAALVNGTPVFRAVADGLGNVETREARRRTILSKVLDIRRLTPPERPAFLEVSLTNWMVDLSAPLEIARTLGSEYEVVRPDHLVALYRRAKIR